MGYDMLAKIKTSYERLREFKISSANFSGSIEMQEIKKVESKYRTINILYIKLIILVKYKIMISSFNIA